MKKETLALISMMALSACGGGGGGGSGGGGSPAAAAPAAAVAAPVSSPSPSPSPSCKPLVRAWSTLTTPEDKLMGSYVGPATNGPTYTQDLSDSGELHAAYDATHTCYYELTVQATQYTVSSFRGCSDPNWSAPNGVNYVQCGYCIDTAMSDLPRVYSYSLSCSTLTITDTATNKTSVYN